MELVNGKNGPRLVSEAVGLKCDMPVHGHSFDQYVDSDREIDTENAWLDEKT